MSHIDGSLPAFVERAQQDAQWQAALTRVGYRRVKAGFARQLRESPKVEIFYGIEHLRQWPTMDFVRDWLKAEKRRAMARVRWTFVGAMLATIIAVLAFTVALGFWR
jgi:pheromone shutdown protein TraB